MHDTVRGRLPEAMPSPALAVRERTTTAVRASQVVESAGTGPQPDSTFAALDSLSELRLRSNQLEDTARLVDQPADDGWFGWYSGIEVGATQAYGRLAAPMALSIGGVFGPVRAGVRPFDVLMLAAEDGDDGAITLGYAAEFKISLRPHLPITLGAGYLRRGMDLVGGGLVPESENTWQLYKTAGLEFLEKGGSHWTVEARLVQTRVEIMLSSFKVRH